MSAPLAGVRVVELARILAGPWAGQVLVTLVNQIGQWAGAFLDWIAPIQAIAELRHESHAWAVAAWLRRRGR